MEREKGFRVLAILPADDRNRLSNLKPNPFRHYSLYQRNESWSYLCLLEAANFLKVSK